MQFLKFLIGQPNSKKKTKTDSHGSANKKMKKIAIYTSITFFIIAVVFVYITFRGNSQAGLIEVSCAAFLSVIFLHILKIIIPQSSGKIVTLLSILIAVMLIYANYSLQKNQHQEYTFKKLLVGDLLVKKIIGTHEETPEQLLTKKLKEIIPGEFAQTKTEKDTIESPFEKPEKVLMGKPATLPLDKPISVSMRKEKLHPLGMPKETVNYKLKVAEKEGLRVDMARAVTAGFVVRLDKFNEQISGPNTPAPLYLPSEAEIINSRLYRAIYSKPELPAVISEVQMQTAISEEHVMDEPGEQVLEKLQIQQRQEK